MQCLAWLFRCHLPVETVDVEVIITSMQGAHTFRRDRTCQIIKCNLWSTRLCPHPTIIKKVKTFLELEGNFRSNLQIRKDSKATEKRKQLIPTKKYKVKVVARPDPSNTTAQLPQANTNVPANPGNQKPQTSENNPPPLEDASVHVNASWAKAGKMSEGCQVERCQIKEGLANSPYHQHCHCHKT